MITTNVNKKPRPEFESRMPHAQQPNHRKSTPMNTECDICGGIDPDCANCELIQAHKEQHLMPQPRTPEIAAARRAIRTTARHLAHISRDAQPHTLAQLHTDLGRAITILAGAELKASAAHKTHKEHHDTNTRKA